MTIRPSGLKYKIVVKNKGWFKKGNIPYFKNKKMPIEIRKKLSLSHKGQISSMKGKSSSYKGEKHWNWQGGIANKDRMERVRFLKYFQKKVFERDNYTCQLCGIRGVNLQVDHIQSWADYVKLRFNINNCRTLCAKCHYQITFGKPMSESIQGWGHHFLDRRKQI